MVSLKTVDRLVGFLVLMILLFSAYSWWSAAKRTSAMMMQMPSADPIWYLFGGLVTASVVVGSYTLGRDYVAQTISEHEELASSQEVKEPSAEGERTKEVTPGQTGEHKMAEQPALRGTSVLEVLPEDEHRILRPIVESPGLTQVELRGRSNFSKAKVSQTVSELEDRGLLYREKQGRTYRIYPGKLLTEQQ